MWALYLITMFISVVTNAILRIPYEIMADIVLVLSIITGFAFVIQVIEKKGGN